jgi:hypothetical protein
VCFSFVLAYLVRDELRYIHIYLGVFATGYGALCLLYIGVFLPLFGILIRVFFFLLWGYLNTDNGAFYLRFFWG